MDALERLRYINDVEAIKTNRFDFVCKKKLWVKDLNFCMDESMNKVQR